MHDTLADAALIATSCLYAAWLSEHKDLEPDWTWVEVGIGVGYCLLRAAAHGARHGGDWRMQQRATWRAFLLGGIPIAIGEILQGQRRAREREKLAERWG